MSDLGLANKRVIVTGAAGGLGRAFAEGFSDAGAHVIAADLNESGARETAEGITRAGGQAIGAKVDVTSATSCAALATVAEQTLGGLDIVINNAAIYAGLERKPFAEIEEDVWDKVMAVNVKGVWQMTRAASPLIKQAGGGAIVNVASATVFSGSPQWMHYVASKGAVIAMTRSLARELGDDGIRANVIAPGFTLTEASLDLIEDAQNYGVTRGALKRSADAHDMVGSALYLASDLAGFVTGQTLVVDGGRQFI
ncbi:glucose 1-dehydrogenase [Sulfitobacter sp. M57]|uniref:SDR family NAD(P)-dependent oxidoreductase n=1 Tax=unclassified Sulfitobacter TaxID=196795 RepID=UPI0023E3177E|nr:MULTISPECIES: glucose 1-dehydrogenase [unclassified Sulfitobacter]MDF3416102.1 glucose 1-dehydrogenase [Sulfitobacter sp. KE5]MDF3423581.1 glucose 1-dehydrogenase [Sulfitobacter sp. KE43]MDF3434617.1 glucose 1-dehydrogenase [Sulfitobacter sp. KE42]MDF3460287.1 glucose 1-dehydrogenase [Sulfitobacter sp. S74]MDF3464155.1 glucose 1-dehydrogenase [Sulfitobacter sp. Ks18]